MLDIDVLNWRGPQFLVFYIVACAVTFAVAKWVRTSATSKPPGVKIATLDPDYLAWLAGGDDRVAQTAVTRLMQLGHLTTDPQDPTTLRRGRPLDPQSGPYDAALITALTDLPGASALSRARDVLKPWTTQIERQTLAWGLRLGPDDNLEFRLKPALIAGLPVLLGVAKILIGLSRDRPVEFLVFGVAVWSLVVWIKFARAPYPNSRETTAELAALRRQAETIRTQAASRPEALNGRDLALLVGLFGIASVAFASGPMADMASAITPPRPNGGSGDSGSSSSGDGGGDGGSGGGCGGCGGGGGGGD